MANKLCSNTWATVIINYKSTACVLGVSDKIVSECRFKELATLCINF